MCLVLVAPLWAIPTDTCTPTPTCTVSPTATPSATSTATPGEGSWTFIPSSLPLVSGLAGQKAIFTYRAGATDWPGSGGLLSIFFPAGIEAPTATNFYVDPGYSSEVQSYGYSGQCVSVTVKGLTAGSTIPFFFGYDPTGFAVSTTASPLTFGVAANVASASAAGGLVTPDPAQPILVAATSTPTFTLTCTPTITTTDPDTPTVTPTNTVTPTWTQSPIGPPVTTGVYSYPNPFDMKKFDKCTFRFPMGGADAKVTVFNLVGEPVRELPSTDINVAQGWAPWPGVDDYLRPVTGGLYFVRVRTTGGTFIKKFTVLH